MRRERRLEFYSRYAIETAAKAWGYFKVFRQAKRTLKEVLAAPDRWSYLDVAIAPPGDDEFDSLALYHATGGGKEALARKRREDESRARAAERAKAAGGTLVRERGP